MDTIDLNERPQSRDELAVWYTAALDEQASGGLSMAEYAEELGVTATTLYQWKRRLSAEEEDRAEYETPSSMGLVEVSLEGPSSSDNAENFVVRLDDGRCVEVPQRFNDAGLIRLLQLLESC